MKTLFRAVALSALMSAAALSVQAQPAAPPMVMPMAMAHPSTFNLAAYGEVRVAPDMATINLGVMTEALTASEAMRQNAERMSQVMGALGRAGISAENIQTSAINLNAQYDYRENQPPVLRGYQANNQVTIRVMDIANLGRAIDAVVAAGSNQINGISFGLKDPTAAENAARREAVRALRAKADLYAQATGLRLVRLMTLSEGGGYAPQPPVPMPIYARAEMAQSATPVSGGELAVRIDINGVYEIAN